MPDEIPDRVAANAASDGYTVENETDTAADNPIDHEHLSNDTCTSDVGTSHSNANGSVEVSWLQPVGSMSNEPTRNNPYLNAIDDEREHSTVLHGVDRDQQVYRLQANIKDLEANLLQLRYEKESLTEDNAKMRKQLFGIMNRYHIPPNDNRSPDLPKSIETYIEIGHKRQKVANAEHVKSLQSLHREIDQLKTRADGLVVERDDHNRLLKDLMEQRTANSRLSNVINQIQVIPDPEPDEAARIRETMARNMQRSRSSRGTFGT